MTDQLQVVVGAGGATGQLVVQHLLDTGRPVRAVTREGRRWTARGTSQPQWAAADARDPNAMAAVCQGAAVVYHCVMPPLPRWQTEFPLVNDAILHGATRAGARLVYADDTWMYGRVEVPMRADTPWRPVSRPGVLRAWLAERVLRAGESGRLSVSVVRAGELYGPGVRSMLAGNVFGASVRGRTARWLGDPEQPLTPTFVDDFARTLVAVGDDASGTAAVWHVPHPSPTTGRELVKEAYRQAGYPERMRCYGARQLRVLGLVSPLLRRAAELVYQFERPFVVDGQETLARFGVQPTPYVQGIESTLGALSPRPSGKGTRSAGTDTTAVPRARQERRPNERPSTRGGAS